MVSLFRLKGRALQLDSTVITALSFFTGLLLMITVGFLPALYGRFISEFVAFESRKLSVLLDFFVSLFLIFTAYGAYSAVRLGVKRYLFKKALKKRSNAGDIFFYFRPVNFFSSLFYCMKMLSVKLVLFIFCFFPCAVCLFAVAVFFRRDVSALVCLSLAVTALCLSLNAGVFFSLFYSSFFLCDYYFIDGSYVSFRHLISCSQKDMAKKNALLTKLKISFAGWLAISVLIFPVPYVWGYYNQSLAVAAADFMKQKAS